MTTHERPIALITGAGSGIGREAARLLADEGYDLALVARTTEALHETAERCDGDALILSADLTDPKAAASIVDDTLEAYGRLDAIINNAGTAPLVGIGETDADTIARCYALNAIAPAITIARAWPTLVERRGRVVNTSTIGTQDPFEGFFAYAASKTPVNLMAASCHKEGLIDGEQRVHAFAVAPGAVETPMLRSLFDENAIPSANCLTPEQVARVITDCAIGRRNDESGQVIWLPNP